MSPNEMVRETKNKAGNFIPAIRKF